MAQIVAAILALAKAIPQVAQLINMLKDELLKAELAAIESREKQLKYELDKITAIHQLAVKSGNKDEIINAHRMLVRWHDSYRV